MTTYYLKFPNEATFLSIVRNIGAIVETENGPILQAYSNVWALDCIGSITKHDNEGNIVETISGYHVNAKFTVPLPSEFEQYIITPSTPSRIFG